MCILQIPDNVIENNNNLQTKFKFSLFCTAVCYLQRYVLSFCACNLTLQYFRCLSTAQLLVCSNYCWYQSKVGCTVRNIRVWLLLSDENSRSWIVILNIIHFTMQHIIYINLFKQDTVQRYFFVDWLKVYHTFFPLPSLQSVTCNHRILLYIVNSNAIGWQRGHIERPFFAYFSAISETYVRYCKVILCTLA
jgi:hypothetical protein